MQLAARAIQPLQRASQPAALSLQHGPATLRSAQPCSGRSAAQARAQRSVWWHLAAIKGVESYDASVELGEEQREALEDLLRSELFYNEVVQSCKLPAGTQVEWTGVLFPPLPWSPTTKKGMPQEIEERFHGKPEFTIINVPPVFMFKAKIFKPARLCTIYRHVGQASE